MFIWKYIDIPQDDIEKIQQEFLDRLPNNGLFFQNIKINSTHLLGLRIEVTVLIQMPPMSGFDNYNIHSDYGSPDRSPLAINIPLQNCAESITKFWKANKPVEIRQTPEGTPYRYINVNDCEQISELKFTKPFIFDTSIPHNVVNPQNVWRRGISLRFLDDPSHLIK